MYLEITTRCNMRCIHCCWSRNGRGEDMSMDVLKAALKLADGNEETISIGGGEPTLHPGFKEMLIEIISHSSEDLPPWIATNGSRREEALLLARLSMAGVIQAVLSWDDFHDRDMVDDEVHDAFAKIRGLWGNGSRRIGANGRALRNRTTLENMGYSLTDECACPDIFVRASGDIHVCGCKDSPRIGDVWDGYEYPENPGECFRNQPMKETMRG